MICSDNETSVLIHHLIFLQKPNNTLKLICFLLQYEVYVSEILEMYSSREEKLMIVRAVNNYI